MPTIPWTARTDDRTDGHTNDAPPTGEQPEVYVQVSRLRLRHARHIPGFLTAALRIRRATLQTPGALGVSLRAHPLQATFWTLSAWTDPASIAGFVRSPAHREVMVRYGDRIADAQFHTFSHAQGQAHRPDWDDAQRRLREAGANAPV